MWWGDDTELSRTYTQALANRSGAVVPLLSGPPDSAHVAHEWYLCVDPPPPTATQHCWMDNATARWGANYVSSVPANSDSAGCAFGEVSTSIRQGFFAASAVFSTGARSPTSLIRCASMPTALATCV